MKEQSYEQGKCELNLARAYDMQTQIRTITKDGVTVEYILTRKSVKNINMRIKLDGSVNVSASNRTTIKSIEQFILSKFDFVLDAKESMRKKAENSSNSLELKDGEQFQYLGSKYNIKVEQAEAEGVQIIEQNLIIKTKLVDDYDRKLMLIDSFLIQQSKVLFEEISRKVYPLFVYACDGYPQMKIKKLKSKWGSCTPSKNLITLNSQLMQKRVEAIEYVILHEYCHFVWFDHSKDFYALVARYMPDWKVRKGLLRQ